MSRDTYQPGKVPKVLRCNAGLYEASMYKNLGNGARLRFLWAGSGTVSGTAATVIASGVGYGATKNYYGREMDDAYVVVTPTTTVSGRLYVVKDGSAHTVSVRSTSNEGTAVTFDYMIFTV